MKTIGKLFMLGAVLLAVGCTKPMEKSVIVKMEMEELEKVMVEQDSPFPKFYEVAQAKVSLLGDTDKIKFQELTYQRAYDYYKKTQTFYGVGGMVTILADKWNKEYDSIIENATVETMFEIPTRGEYLNVKSDSLRKSWDLLAFEFFSGKY